MDRGNSFTALRLAAAVQVMVSHAAGHLGFADEVMVRFIALFPGVPVFFFLSGYLVSASYQGSASLGDYAWRRVTRIFPALWGALFFSVATLALLHPVEAWTLISWSALQATGAQLWNPEAWRGYGVGVVNGSLWSIPVELCFYAALPLLVRLRSRALIAIGAGSFAVLYAGAAAQANLILISPLPWFGLFIAGMLASRFDWRPRLGLWLPLLVLVVSLSAALPVTSLFESAGNTSGIANLAVLCGASLAFGLRRGPVLPIDLSYGLYLYHMPVLNAALALGVTGPGAFAATLAASLAMALLSWLALERTARRRAIERSLRHLGRKASAASGAAADRASAAS